jgi:hypothetical protein
MTVQEEQAEIRKMSEERRRLLGKPAGNPRAVIGGNLPPSAIEIAEPTIEALRAYLADNPVIGNDAEAREAKALLDRTAAALKGIEDERKAKVAPLNAELTAINQEYHRWHNSSGKPGLWDKLLAELRSRLGAFARAEEAKRQAAAEAARKAAAEAERKAREAEAREREAAEEAAQGVCTDIAQATQEADAAFAQFKRADREAQRADRNATVRIGGGLGKVSTLRTVEVLTVIDWRAAIEDMTNHTGAPPTVIVEAILTAARAYRGENRELPAGISASFDRRI